MTGKWGSKLGGWARNLLVSAALLLLAACGESSSGSAFPPPVPPADDRPWLDNTGPKDVEALESSGPITLSSPGVYENLDVNGDIYITSSDVTVRNFRVDASGIQRGISIESGLSNIVLEDGEIFLSLIHI